MGEKWIRRAGVSKRLKFLAVSFNSDEVSQGKQPNYMLLRCRLGNKDLETRTYCCKVSFPKPAAPGVSLFHHLQALGKSGRPFGAGGKEWQWSPRAYFHEHSSHGFAFSCPFPRMTVFMDFLFPLGGGGNLSNQSSAAWPHGGVILTLFVVTQGTRPCCTVLKAARGPWLSACVPILEETTSSGLLAVITVVKLPITDGWRRLSWSHK